MRELTRFVINYTDIPEGMIPNNHWINQHGTEVYIPYTMDHDSSIGGSSLFDNWLFENYPNLLNREFLIYIDY